LPKYVFNIGFEVLVHSYRVLKPTWTVINSDVTFLDSSNNVATSSDVVPLPVLVTKSYLLRIWHLSRLSLLSVLCNSLRY
jgi:hypothetical protein